MKKLAAIILFILYCGLGILKSQGIYQLWGTTGKGGISNYGTLFSTDQYGNKYTVRKSFTSEFTGARPQSTKLVDYNGKLYGVTYLGGTWDLGVVFRYDPVTNQYELIHSFSGIDGEKPLRGLTVFGNKLYGLTTAGGINGVGVLYEIDPATKIFTKKLDLNNTTTGGAPFGAMVEYNGKLYGTLRFGGANNLGVIFSYTPSSNLFQILYNLTSNDVGVGGGGGGILGDLCIYNNKFYGATPIGGINNFGSFIEFNPATNAFNTLYSFTFQSNAFGGLTVLNNKFYGTTGSNIYEFDPATNTYTSEFTFTASSPYAKELLVYNNTLWGLSQSGGVNNVGVVFEYNPVTNIFFKKADFSSTAIGNTSVTGVLAIFNGKLYGLAVRGGILDFGTCFEFDPATNILAKEFDFNNASNEGSFPNGGVVLLGSKLYGITETGGDFGVGMIYNYDLLNSTFQKRASYNNFYNSLSTTFSSYGRLTFFNNKFYGLTNAGGQAPNGESGGGGIITFDTSTNIISLEHLHVNDPVSNRNMGTEGTLTLSNNKFYGLSPGTMFEYDPVGHIITRRYLADGSGPSQMSRGNGLTEFNGKFYALSTQGGSPSSIGTISEYDPATLQFTLKMGLGSLGSFPRGAFTKVNNKLYGTVPNGIIEYDPVANTAVKKYTIPDVASFTPIYAWSDLTPVSNRLYGTARDGGNNGLGIFYEYDLNTNTFTKKLDFGGANGATPTFCKIETVPAIVSTGIPGSCYSLSPVTINSSNNNEWVAFTDDKGDAIAEINANGNNLGQVNISLYVHNGAIRSDGNNNKFLNRNINITSTNSPGSPVGIRLYIRQSEADALIAAPGSGATQINDIRLFRSSNICQSAIPDLVDSIPSSISNWMGGYVYTASVSNFSTYNYTSKNYLAPTCPVSITNNTISAVANTICGAVNSTLITGSTPSGGNGTYQYEWQSSIDNINFAPIPGASSKDYTATNISQSIYFKRKVLSGPCINVSSIILISYSPIPPTPTITAGTITTFCTGGSVTLTSNAASGNQWYKDGVAINGSTATTYIANASGSYTTKISLNGCSSAASNAIVVTVNPIPATPTITAGTATTFCTGGSVTLTSNAVSGNQWYKDGIAISSSTATTYIANASGSYTVKVTLNSCVSTISNAIIVTVNSIPATPTITAGTATTFCTGGSVTLTSNAASGNQWYKDGIAIGGSTATTYIANASGSYTIKVTLSGCESSTSNAIVVTVISITPAPTISPAAPLLCSGNAPLALNVTAPFLSGTLSQSSGTINIPIIDNSVAGSNNSINISTIPAGAVITNVVIHMNATHSFIGDMVVVLKSPNAQVLNLDYCISQTGAGTGILAPAFTNTMISSSGLNLLSTGVQPYSATFKADAATTPTFFNTPTGPTAFTPTTNLWNALYTIPNGNWTLAWADLFPGDAGTFISWSIDITYTTIIPYPCIWTPNTGLYTDAAGTIPYTGTALSTVYAKPTVFTNYSVSYSVGSCSSPATSVPVTVTQTPTTPTITAGTAITFCTGGSVTLTSNAANGNQWYKDGIAIGGSTATTYIANASGSYTVKVILNSCVSATSNAIVVLVNPLPPIPTITATGNILQSSSVSGNQWFLNSVSIGGATNQQYTVQAAGPYTVQVTLNGCNSISSVFNFVATGIVNPSAWNYDVVVFPNPVNDNLYISNRSNRKLDITIMDITGKVALHYYLNVTNGSVNMKKLARGTYLVSITDKQKNETIHKLIIKQ